MGIVLSLLLSFLKKYWLPLTIVAVASFTIWNYGHDQYKKGKKVGEEAVAQMRESNQRVLAELRRCRESTAELVSALNVELDKQRDEVQKLQVQKDESIKRNDANYRKRIQKVLDENRILKDKINDPKILGSNDTVSLPVNFRLLYNRAADSFGHPSGEGKDNHSGDPFAPSGETETFAIAPYSEVVIGNVMYCNEVFERYSTLIDIVKEIQTLNR